MAQKKIQGAFRPGQPGINPLQSNKIIVMGDDDVDQFINESLLKSINLYKEIVREISPLKVIDQLKNADRLSSVPEFIFMDVRMEAKEGMHFLEEFNKLSDFVKNKCKIVVISCSQQAMTNKSRILLNPSVSYFLVKPLDAIQLKEILNPKVEH
jgi:response regulator of citrate/malate metabolism